MNPAAVHNGFRGNVLAFAPERVENVIRGRRSRLLLKPLEQLKPRDPILTYGDDLTITFSRPLCLRTPFDVLPVTLIDLTWCPLHQR